MNINPNRGETPMGSGRANPQAPWLRGHPSLRITSVSRVVPEITPPVASIFHFEPQAPWHKVTPLHPNTFMGVVGKVQKNLPKEEGRVEKKAHTARPRGPGLKPGTFRVLGEGPQLRTRGVV